LQEAPVRFKITRKVALSLAAIAAVAGAGGAVAATQSNTDPRKAFLDDVAKRLHVTPAQVTSALQGAQLDQIQAAVAAGRLTQAQADAIKKRIQQGASAGPGLFGPAGGPGRVAPRAVGPGPGGPGRGGPGFFFHGPRFFHGPGADGGPLGAAAKYLGLTETQLFKDIGSGKSLADVAKAQGKSLSGLKAAMTAAIKARLDKAVTAKVLSSAEEQKMLSGISSQLDRELNETHHGFAPGQGEGAGWARPRPSFRGGTPPRGLFHFGSAPVTPSPARPVGPVA
jgi:hypothetical protein